MGDNVIETLGDVDSGYVCQEACESDPECLFYTYHKVNSTLFPSTCFLLTGLEGPILPCDDGSCSSGTPGGRGSFCAFLDADGQGRNSTALELLVNRPILYLPDICNR